jgi:hypothetical protein
MRFFWADAEKGDQSQQRVAGADHTSETRLVEPECRQKLALFISVCELCYFRLDRRRDRHQAGAARAGIFGDPVALGVPSAALASSTLAM